MNVTGNVTEIDGIKFFNTSKECITDYEKANGWLGMAISLIKSFGTLLLYAIYQISLRCRNIYQPTLTLEHEKTRLIVCLHGLNNGPRQFDRIVGEICAQHPENTTILVPEIADRGNAPLSEMTKQIVQNIINWAKTSKTIENPEKKELVLVGISNGSRIARAVVAELTSKYVSECTNLERIRFVSIVGANKGSSMANLAHKLHLSCLMSKNIAKEMPTDSERIAELNRNAEESLKVSSHIQRDYTFIASPHDWQVPNYESTLMDVPNQKCQYALITGHGHNSIVNSVAKTVATIVCTRPQ